MSIISLHFTYYSDAYVLHFYVEGHLIEYEYYEAQHIQRIKMVICWSNSHKLWLTTSWSLIAAFHNFSEFGANKTQMILIIRIWLRSQNIRNCLLLLSKFEMSRILTIAITCNALYLFIYFSVDNKILRYGCWYLVCMKWIIIFFKNSSAMYNVLNLISFNSILFNQ